MGEDLALAHQVHIPVSSLGYSNLNDRYSRYYRCYPHTPNGFRISRFLLMGGKNIARRRACDISLIVWNSRIALWQNDNACLVAINAKCKCKAVAVPLARSSRGQPVVVGESGANPPPCARRPAQRPTRSSRGPPCRSPHCPGRASPPPTAGAARRRDSRRRLLPS